MPYTGPERRRVPRVAGRFIVSYRVFEESDGIDISQTKNICGGGMLLTTNIQFPAGTNLVLEMRLPFDPVPIKIVAKVLESREITRNLIYDTRLLFLSVDEKHKKAISETVNYYLRKG